MARRPIKLSDVEKTLRGLEPAFRKAFLDAVADVRSTAQLQTIAGHLADGNVEAALLAVRLSPSFFSPMDRAVQQAYLAGGADALAGLPRITDPLSGGPLLLRFDGRARRAESWVRDHSSRLISEILEDQRTMIRTALRSGLEAGRNPRSVALDLIGRTNKVTGQRDGGLIGLTTRQADYVTNARLQLSSGNVTEMRAYLSRSLRDKRYDGIVNKAIREGRPLSAAEVEKIAARYSDKLLRHRGETIARTESITALRAGQSEAVEQLVETGSIDHQQVVRRWDATLDKRTREDHVAMHGKTVEGLHTPFIMPDGSRMLYPGDTSLGALGAQTINCRCMQQVEIDFLAGVQ